MFFETGAPQRITASLRADDAWSDPNGISFKWAGVAWDAALQGKFNAATEGLLGETVTFALVYDATNYNNSVSTAPDISADQASSDFKIYYKKPGGQDTAHARGQ